MTEEDRAALESDVLTAVGQDIPMKNPEQIEAFYTAYQKNQDAQVIVFHENPNGTVTLTVDGIWIEEGTDCAFTNTLVVQPFEDGTFRYLSNVIWPKETAVPAVPD